MKKKRMTKIRIKYLLILISLCIVLNIIFPTFMKYYVSVTGNAVGYAKETRSSTYKVKFHNNGGSGSMSDMTVTYNQAVNLTKNTFTKTDYCFAGWNTDANGSGTIYRDEQEINNTSYIPNNEINLYAQWTQKTAEISGTYYDTLQLAIDSVTADGVEVEIRLLKNTSEIIITPTGTNINLNLQNHTLSNYENNPVIQNNGTLKISNGNITTNASTNGAVNNLKNATMEINGVRIESTGGRQALYNNEGTATILGNSYLSSVTNARPAVTNNNAKSTLIIRSATIISTQQSGIENKGTLTIGTEDGTYNRDAITIKGSAYGINCSSGNKFEFFDGVIKGKTSALTNTQNVKKTETGYFVIYTELENDENYKTAFLENQTETITFNAKGGTSSEASRVVGKGTAIGNLPTAAKSGFTFDGWFTQEEGGEQITKNTIINSSFTVFAHWTMRQAVELNGTIYSSINDALTHVPNNTKSTITLLEDLDDSVKIQSTKNVVIDLNGKTLNAFSTTAAVIENFGTLEVKNGKITSNATNHATIDNQSSATLKLDNVTLKHTAGRQALYNDGGYVEISGASHFEAAPAGRYSVLQLDRATIQNFNNGTMIITSATVVATSQIGLANEATLTLGTEDGTVANTPTITGVQAGVSNIGTFNYYDGIIKGKTVAISGSITDEDETMQKVDGTETISETQYHTVHLELLPPPAENTSNEEPSNQEEPQSQNSVLNNMLNNELNTMQNSAPQENMVAPANLNTNSDTEQNENNENTEENEGTETPTPGE